MDQTQFFLILYKASEAMSRCSEQQFLNAATDPYLLGGLHQTRMLSGCFSMHLLCFVRFRPFFHFVWVALIFSNISPVTIFQLQFCLCEFVINPKPLKQQLLTRRLFHLWSKKRLFWVATVASFAGVLLTQTFFFRVLLFVNLSILHLIVQHSSINSH